MTGLLLLEIRKRWESLKWPALGVLLLALALAVATGLLTPAGGSEADPTPPAAVNALHTPLMLLLHVIWLYPLADAVWRFYADLAGRHAPLDVGAAKPAWMKVLAKVLVSLAFFMVSTWVAVGIQAVRTLVSPRTAGGVVGWELFTFEPLGLVQILTYGLVALAAIAAFRVLRHRTPLAAPLAVVGGAGTIWALGLLTSGVDAAGRGYTPIADRLVPGGSWIVPIAIAGLAFAASSWLYDRVDG